MSIAPGDLTDSVTFVPGDVENIDGLLIDNNDVFIIDNEGNFIDIGAGYDEGDGVNLVSFDGGDSLLGSFQVGDAVDTTIWVPGD